jgi:hypothetical protein
MLFRLLIIGKISFQGAGAAEILIYQNLCGGRLGPRSSDGLRASRHRKIINIASPRKAGDILGCTERIFTVEGSRVTTALIGTVPLCVFQLSECANASAFILTGLHA